MVERDDGALQAPQRPSPMQSQASRQEGASTQSTATPPAVAKLARPDVQGEVPRSTPFPSTVAAPPPASPPAMRPEPAAPTSSGETRLLQQARKTAPQTANDVASATGQANGTSAASPQALDAPAAKMKDVPPRPADEWIKLIQRLRYEGKIAQAAKELASFRDAYKDKADALLPPDLRDARP
jgi:hypothetical protein